MGIEENPQGIIAREELSVRGIINFVNPRPAHLADLTNPAHDLDSLVVARWGEVFDIMPSLKNRPIAATQLLQRMAGGADGVIVSLLDPVEKHRVVNPPHGIELIRLDAARGPVTIAILDLLGFVHADA